MPTDFRIKRKKILDVMRNDELPELAKRILTYFLLTFERGDEIEMSQAELRHELNAKNLPHVSTALSSLVDNGFVEKTIKGKGRVYKLIY